MKYKLTSDTLIINRDHTFYHSSVKENKGMKYIRNGKWHSTVDGYFELLNYSDATMIKSLDMKPYKFDNDNMIYMDMSYDGEEKYKRIKTQYRYW